MPGIVPKVIFVCLPNNVWNTLSLSWPRILPHAPLFPENTFPGNILLALRRLTGNKRNESYFGKMQLAFVAAHTGLIEDIVTGQSPPDRVAVLDQESTRGCTDPSDENVVRLCLIL